MLHQQTSKLDLFSDSFAGTRICSQPNTIDSFCKDNCHRTVFCVWCTLYRHGWPFYDRLAVCVDLFCQVEKIEQHQTSLGVRDVCIRLEAIAKIDQSSMSRDFVSCSPPSPVNIMARSSFWLGIKIRREWIGWIQVIEIRSQTDRQWAEAIATQVNDVYYLNGGVLALLTTQCWNEWHCMPSV